MRVVFKLFFYPFVVVLLGLIALLVAEIYYTANGAYAIAGIEYNKNTLWKWRANLNVEAYNAELGNYRQHTDSKGFRNIGKSYSGAKDDNTIRILVIGDSYTIGLAYPDTCIFTVLLERNLNSRAKGKKIEVFNMASPAWGTEQEYRCLVNEGLHIKPDFVLLMTCPNDLRETYCKQFAQLKGGQVQFNLPPFQPWEIRRWKLSNYSCFYQHLQKDVYHTSFGTFDFLMSRFRFNFGIGDSISWDRPMFLKQPFAQLNEAWQLYDTLLVSMQRSCEEHNAQFAVSCTPFIMEFDSTMEVDTALAPGIVSERIASFCSTADIPFINLYTSFAAADDPKALFNPADQHFSAAGFRVTANALTEFYKEKIK